MGGIMMLADTDWVAYQSNRPTDDPAIFYASPHKKTNRQPQDPLFCVNAGSTRSIVAVGLIQNQTLIHSDDAWAQYRNALGADTEVDWREQASAVLANCRKTYDGKMLAIELVDFQRYDTPVKMEEVGLPDTKWSDKKNLDETTTAELLSRIHYYSAATDLNNICLLYTSPSPRDRG